MQRRTLLKTLLAAGTCAALPPVSRAGSVARLPPALRAGMTVGLVAPASNTREDEDIAFAVDLVRSLGFEVKAGANLHQRQQYLAGTDVQRALDINAMFADPQVDAIFCMRGGYGTPRLLPLLDYGVIGRHPKVLLGYSDITALLNAVHLRTGMITFHGPMAAQNFSDYTLAEFQKVLVQASAPVTIAAPPPFAAGPGRVEHANRITCFRGGRTEGRLLGGNLTLLCQLLGTPFEPDFRGKILFVEDIGEAPYRIDRMLTQLWLAGKLQQLKGLAFGKFTDAQTDGNSFSIEEVIRQRCADLNIPVVRGLMIGHVEDQTVVPIGGLARLDGDSGRLTLLEPAVAV